MHKLISGLHEFQSNIFLSHKELFERLAQGQKPDALFITCSDSRINPNLLTQTQPGELFILRNAGNLVPPYGEDNGGEAATIEYAVVALGVKDIIVCGHSCCGAMQGLWQPESLVNLPAMRSWLSLAERTRRAVVENYGSVGEQERLNICTQENVLAQLKNLRTHPSVARRLESGELNLHGWIYAFETGEVFIYQPDIGQFVAFNEVKLPALRSDNQTTI